MTEFKKVMLAVKADLEKIKFPVLASPKLDGIRCVTPLGEAKSRTLKDIPNHHIRRLLSELPYARNLDGELVTLDADGNIEDFNTIQGNVMRHDGIAKFQLLVFDSIMWPEKGFQYRLEQAERQCESVNGRDDGIVKMVPHVMVENMEQLNEFEAACIAQGYEGVMTRSPDGPYKYGRSTVNQGWLLKIKRFDDCEGTVIGATVMKDKDGNVKPGMLGSLEVETDEFGRFEVGSGFTAQQRSDYWHEQDELIGKLVTIKYQPFGMKDKPRFPTFKGFRHEDDT